MSPSSPWLWTAICLSCWALGWTTLQPQTILPGTRIPSTPATHNWSESVAARAVGENVSAPATSAPSRRVKTAAPRRSNESTEPTTWIIIRHAERNGKLDELTELGRQRADQIRQLGAVLKVQAIYTTNFQRTRDTIQPLADALQITPVVYQDINDAWVDKVRNQHPGQTVLIVGHSNTAGLLAGKLAGQPGRMLAEDEFNAMFIVKTKGGQAEGWVEIPYGQ